MTDDAELAVAVDATPSGATLSTAHGAVWIDPSAGLPLATGVAASIHFRGLDTQSSPSVLSFLREGRRVLRDGGSATIDATTGRRVAATLGEGDDGIDRIGRFIGLQLHTDPAQWTFTLQLPALSDTALVSILIPGYRTTFLDEVLHSARAQQWPWLEILVGDDGPADEPDTAPDTGRRPSIESITAAHAAEDPRVRYIGPAAQRGGLPNLTHLLDEANGQLIKVLNDDDLLDPRCVERMAKVLIEHPRVTLVTSHRQPIDAGGRSLTDLTPTRRRVIVDSILDGPSAAADVINRGYNWIGEPTTTMFRAASIDSANPFGVGDEPALTSGDLALWLKLLARGDLAYLASTLSSFRQHDGQRQKEPEFIAIAGAAQAHSFTLASQFGLDEPRHRRLIATPLQDRPWWSATVRRLVAELGLDNATSTLARLHQLQPADPDIAMLEAHVALAQGDAEAAVHILDTAADSHPDAPGLVKLLGVALLHLDEVPMARRILGYAADHCPYDEDLVGTLHAIDQTSLNHT